MGRVMPTEIKSSLFVLPRTSVRIEVRHEEDAAVTHHNTQFFKFIYCCGILLTLQSSSADEISVLKSLTSILPDPVQSVFSGS